MKWTFALLKHACQGEAFLCGIQLETQILEADAKDLSSHIPLGREESSKAPTLLQSSHSHDEACIHQVPEETRAIGSLPPYRYFEGT